MRDRPLSPTQRSMLRGAYGEPYRDVRGQSAHGGADGTWRSLVRRGLLARGDDGLEITDNGVAWLVANGLLDEAVFKERERIRERYKSHLGALITSRADEYGQGWNGALRQVLANLGD